MKIWRALFIGSFATVGCSSAASEHRAPPSAALAVALSSVSLHTAYNDFLARGGLASIRRVPVDKLYQDGLATSTDAPYDMTDLGLRWEQVHQTLLGQKDAFAALSAKFPTVGDLLDAGLLAGGAQTSLSDFQAVFKALGSNLALVDTGHLTCGDTQYSQGKLQTVPNVVNYQHGTVTYQPPFQAGITPVYVYPNKGSPLAVKPLDSSGFITVNGQTSARKGDTSTLEALMAHPGLTQIGSLGQQVSIQSQCPKVSPVASSKGLGTYYPTNDGVENSLTMPLLYSSAD